MEDPILQTANEPELDILPIDQAYQQNQEELSHDSTCSRNYIHEEITEKKNWIKIVSHEGDIQLSIRHTSSEHEGDQRLLIERFRPKQDESSYKSTCFGKLTHHRCTANWNHPKIPYGLKVIQLLNQEMSGLPYLQAHGFNHLQTRLWRPGEAHNCSEGTHKHPGGSFIILEGSDLRTNPFKGGGDGVISFSLSFKDLNINYESSNHDYLPQPARYDGHSGRAQTHLVHAESRDGRISLLPDRSELVRPPEQLHEIMFVSNYSRHVSAQPHTRVKAQKAKEDTKDELGLLMDEPKKVLAEHGPYWPMKLKDRPPWAILGGLLMLVGFFYVSPLRISIGEL